MELGRAALLEGCACSSWQMTGRTTAGGREAGAHWLLRTPTEDGRFHQTAIAGSCCERGTWMFVSWNNEVLPRGPLRHGVYSAILERNSALSPKNHRAPMDTMKDISTSAKDWFSNLTSDLWSISDSSIYSSCMFLAWCGLGCVGGVGGED